MCLYSTRTVGYNGNFKEHVGVVVVKGARAAMVSLAQNQLGAVVCTVLYSTPEVSASQRCYAFRL